MKQILYIKDNIRGLMTLTTLSKDFSFLIFENDKNLQLNFYQLK